MACVMPMLVNKGSTSTIEERKTMVDTFLCGASRIARPITINRSTIRKSMLPCKEGLILCLGRDCYIGSDLGG